MQKRVAEEAERQVKKSVRMEEEGMRTEATRQEEEQGGSQENEGNKK